MLCYSRHVSDSSLPSCIALGQNKLGRRCPNPGIGGYILTIQVLKTADNNLGIFQAPGHKEFGTYNPREKRDFIFMLINIYLYTSKFYMCMARMCYC